METTELVSRMRNESNEVKNSIGGTNAFRSIMETVIKYHTEIIGDFDVFKNRTVKEIAEIVETKHTIKDIESVKNIYELEKKGK